MGATNERGRQDAPAPLLIPEKAEAIPQVVPLGSVNEPGDSSNGIVNGIVNTGENSEQEYPLPTEAELQSLRRVSDKIPLTIYTIGLIELCERFSFYGTVAVFTNFIQWPLPPGSPTGAAPHGQPGAMGFGQRTATALTTFNSFWQYTMPLFGAYVADSYLGRFRTVSVALLIDILGHVALLVSGLPPILTSPSNTMVSFIIGLIAMGFGTGGFKPNINPLIIEQLPSERMRVMTLEKSGERVIVDPAVTASRVYHYFYMFINIGALLGQLGMVYAEKYIGFWLSYLLPTSMLCLCPLVILWGRKRYRRVAPCGSVLGKALRLFARANAGRWSWSPVATYRKLHDGTFWENVKPSKIAPENRPSWMTFDDAWVEEVARGFNACGVFLWSPFFWICYNQMNNNLISQAAVMKLNNVPNDVLTNLNPFALIILIPVLDQFFFPTLRRFRINFTPIKKITVGYAVSVAAMIWAAITQYYIYQRSECGNYASGDRPDGERCANVDINVWVQTGPYVLTAIAEILASITSLEYAHSKAPKNMRSIVQAIALFMNAFASAIGFALVSLAEDPYLVWNYSVVAVLAAVGGVCFWLNFRGLDQREDELNMLPDGSFGAQHGTADGEAAPTASS